jgi:hypothetical protein
MTHYLKVVWNAVPMFLLFDRETGWWVREPWPKVRVCPSLAIQALA